MVTWVLQTNLIDKDQTDAVAFAAKNAGADVIATTVIPFVDDIQMESEPVGKDVIPYGSTKLSRLADKHGWSGMFFDRELFSVPTWLKNRDDMLNDEVEIVSVADLQNFKALDDDVYFIRPVEDLKAFNGTVTNAAEIRRWMSSVESGSFAFSTDTMVAISPAQTIQGEWRWFVVDGKVISGSMYRLHGQRLVQRSTGADIIAEAQKKADMWLPNQTCVMDLALTDRGVRVIEFNCFNSSGFYYHDIPKIVEAVTNYVGNHA
jgi:hypothetical protein